MIKPKFLNPLGWTFAEDFLNSKTTHVAAVTVVAAVLGVVEHRLPNSTAFLSIALTTGVAALRDSHAKYASEIADLLFEGMHLTHLDSTTGEPDGEADATTPTPSADGK